METTPPVPVGSALDSDLVITVIASAFGGALLTAIITLAVFILNGRREHKKWLKDLKYETYLAQLIPLEGLSRLFSSDDTSPETGVKVFELFNSISGVNMTLIASGEVSERHSDVIDELSRVLRSGPTNGNRDTSGVVRAMERLINTMRHDLLIPAKQTVKTRHVQ